MSYPNILHPHINAIAPHSYSGDLDVVLISLADLKSGVVDIRNRYNKFAADNLTGEARKEEQQWVNQWRDVAIAFFDSTLDSISLAADDEGVVERYCASFEIEQIKSVMEDHLQRTRPPRRLKRPSIELQYIGDNNRLSAHERDSLKGYSIFSILLPLLRISHLLIRPGDAPSHLSLMKEYVHFYGQSDLRPILEELVRIIRRDMPFYEPRTQFSLCREVWDLYAHILQTPRSSISLFKKILDDNVDHATATEEQRSIASQPDLFVPTLGELLRRAHIRDKKSIFGTASSRSLAHRQNPILSSRKTFIYDDL